MGMLAWRQWFGGGRRILSMFLAVALLLGGTLLWLGWRMLRQDSELAEQRLQQGRELAADLALAHLQKSLARFQEELASLGAATSADFPKRAAAAALPEDSVMIADHGSD